MQHDVFICHASEDKDELVRPLARALRDANLDVWYDEFGLQVGDSLSEAIDRGLACARFGIVIVSQAFFQKRWTKRELLGLVAREMAEDGKIILPVWHRVSYGEVLGFSPPLADVRAAMANQGVEALARELVRKIRPEGSPLLISRNELLRFDWEPHPLSDEWWLDMVEIQEWIEQPNWIRPLLFPLPNKSSSDTHTRGLRIAWAALQNDWQHDAEQRQICQVTHPDRVNAFLQGRPARRGWWGPAPPHPLPNPYSLPPGPARWVWRAPPPLRPPDPPPPPPRCPGFPGGGGGGRRGGGGHISTSS